ncbi:MAG: hypothetical protein HY537_14210 [Deltaproteobacteria bacterium]|nr:hypothetical protein [Deltaproteobacteria bacterium]
MLSRVQLILFFITVALSHYVPTTVTSQVANSNQQVSLPPASNVPQRCNESLDKPSATAIVEAINKGQAAFSPPSEAIPWWSTPEKNTFLPLDSSLFRLDSSISGSQRSATRWDLFTDSKQHTSETRRDQSALLDALKLYEHLVTGLLCPADPARTQKVQEELDGFAEKYGVGGLYGNYSGLKLIASLHGLQDPRARAAWHEALMTHLSLSKKPAEQIFFQHLESASNGHCTLPHPKKQSTHLQARASEAGLASCHTPAALETLIASIAAKAKRGQPTALTPDESITIRALDPSASNSAELLVGTIETEKLRAMLRSEQPTRVPGTDSDPTLMNAARNSLLGEKLDVSETQCWAAERAEWDETIRQIQQNKKPADREKLRELYSRIQYPSYIVKNKHDLLVYLRCSTTIPEMLRWELRIELTDPSQREALREFVILQLDNLQKNKTSDLLKKNEMSDWQKRFSMEIGLKNGLSFLSLAPQTHSLFVAERETLQRERHARNEAASLLTRHHADIARLKAQFPQASSPLEAARTELNSDIHTLASFVARTADQGLDSGTRALLFSLPRFYRKHLIDRTKSAKTEKEKQDLIRLINDPTEETLADALTNDGKDPDSLVRLLDKEIRRAGLVPPMDVSHISQLTDTQRRQAIDWAGRHLEEVTKESKAGYRLNTKLSPETHAALTEFISAIEEVHHTNGIKEFRTIRNGHFARTPEYVTKLMHIHRETQEKAPPAIKNRVDELIRYMDEEKLPLPVVSRVTLLKMDEAHLKMLFSLKDWMARYPSTKKRFARMLLEPNEQSVEINFTRFAPELYRQSVKYGVLAPLASDDSARLEQARRELGENWAQELFLLSQGKKDPELQKKIDTLQSSLPALLLHTAKPEQLAKAFGEAAKAVATDYEGLTDVNIVRMHAESMAKLASGLELSQAEQQLIENLQNHIVNNLGNTQYKEQIDGKLQEQARHKAAELILRNGGADRRSKAAAVLKPAYAKDEKKLEAKLNELALEEEILAAHGKTLSDFIESREGAAGNISDWNLLAHNPKTEKPSSQQNLKDWKRLEADQNDLLRQTNQKLLDLKAKHQAELITLAIKEHARQKESQPACMDLTQCKLVMSGAHVGDGLPSALSDLLPKLFADQKTIDRICSQLLFKPRSSEQTDNFSVNLPEDIRAEVFSRCREQESLIQTVQNYESELLAQRSGKEQVQTANLERNIQALTREFMEKHVSPHLKIQGKDREAYLKSVDNWAQHAIRNLYDTENEI